MSESISSKIVDDPNQREPRSFQAILNSSGDETQSAASFCPTVLPLLPSDVLSTRKTGSWGEAVTLVDEHLQASINVSLCGRPGGKTIGWRDTV